MFFQKSLKLSVVVAALCFLSLAGDTDAVGERRAALRQDAAAPESGCVSCHSKAADRSVELYSRSAHALSKIACTGCHGGDLFATDKQQAHGGRFVGQPKPDQVMSMCGSCHRAQLDMFKGSRHFPERKGQARIDCVQCHGAHTVGAPAESFSFAYLCAGCHGLEYLPELPDGFQKMMALADDVHRTLRAARESGSRLSDDVIRLRKEIRRSISEIVHPTDTQAGPRKIPEVLKLGEEFKQAVGR